MARIRQAEYERFNSKYLREAEELLAKREYAQASEKLWGACAEIIKAVAAKRGLRLGTHRSLGEFIVKLEKEHPEWGAHRCFFYSQQLSHELLRRLDASRNGGEERSDRQRIFREVKRLALRFDNVDLS